MIPESDRKQFIYRRFWVVMLWALLILVPGNIFMPDFFEKADGILYYALNILITLAALFVFWRLSDYLPGIKMTGCYYRENGRTVLEYGGEKKILDNVEELMLTDRHASSRGIDLMIRNNGEKIEFLSESLNEDIDIETTVFYDMFTQILEENPQLEIVKNIWGGRIPTGGIRPEMIGNHQLSIREIIYVRYNISRHPKLRRTHHRKL